MGQPVSTTIDVADLALVRAPGPERAALAANGVSILVLLRHRH